MSEVKPALTAEEWAREWEGLMATLQTPDDRDPRPHIWLYLEADGTLRLANEDAEGWYGVDDIPPDARHRVAALALRNQPFGFTWEDVDALDEALALEASEGNDHALWPDDLRAALRSLADRIAALLPPREP